MGFPIGAKKSPGTLRNVPQQKSRAQVHGKFGLGPEIFFHPDYTVGTGISPVRSRTYEPLVRTIPDSRAITAGWES